MTVDAPAPLHLANGDGSKSLASWEGIKLGEVFSQGNPLTKESVLGRRRQWQRLSAVLVAG
jgi:hypothetical protein